MTHTRLKDVRTAYRRAQSTGMTAIKLSARLTRGTIMPSALTANERVLGAGISFSVYYNQVAASKKEVAEGRVGGVNWPSTLCYA